MVAVAALWIDWYLPFLCALPGRDVDPSSNAGAVLRPGGTLYLAAAVRVGEIPPGVFEGRREGALCPKDLYHSLPGDILVRGGW